MRCEAEPWPDGRDGGAERAEGMVQALAGVNVLDMASVLAAPGAARHLADFGADVVKVDRSFVRELDARPQDQAIVSAVVELGHTLDLTTIAEGVETEGQLELLRVLGCDLAQGYHFARPRPADEITDLIRGRPAW